MHVKLLAGTIDIDVYVCTHLSIYMELCDAIMGSSVCVLFHFILTTTL